MVPTQSNGETAVKKRGRIENIQRHQFKPGQSGNPGGRSRIITDRMLKELNARATGHGRNKTKLDVFVEKGLDRATKKSDVLYKEIYARVEGKLEETHTIKETITGASGPARITVEHFNLMLCQFYGIPVNPVERDAALSIPGRVDSGSEPPADSEQEP